jgi:hypothetical protein
VVLDGGGKRAILNDSSIHCSLLISAYSLLCKFSNAITRFDDSASMPVSFMRRLVGDGRSGRGVGGKIVVGGRNRVKLSPAGMGNVLEVANGMAAVEKKPSDRDADSAERQQAASLPVQTMTMVVKQYSREARDSTCCFGSISHSLLNIDFRLLIFQFSTFLNVSDNQEFRHPTKNHLCHSLHHDGHRSAH